MFKIGPGLILAGACIGVSHLVQSTRAGGKFALFSIIPVLIIMIIKYPAFYLGPLYTKYTKQNLLNGYAKIGKYSLVFVTLVFLLTMFSSVAAIAILTSSVSLNALGIEHPSLHEFGPIILICIMTLTSLLGGIEFLQRVMRPFISLMALVFLYLAMKNFSQIPLGLEMFPIRDVLKWENLPFMLAFMGWMPSGLDIPLLHSHWIQNKDFDINNYDNDFKIGYALTFIFAVFFIVIGTKSLYLTEVLLSDNNIKFSNSLLQIFTSTVDWKWLRFLIKTGVSLTLISTLMTIIDGFPRVLRDSLGHTGLSRKVNSITLNFFIQAIGSLVIIIYFKQSLKNIIDIATIIAFLAAPFFAYLNHKVVFMVLNDKHRPSNLMRTYSVISVVALSFFSLIFIFQILEII